MRKWKTEKKSPKIFARYVHVFRSYYLIIVSHAILHPFFFLHVRLVVFFLAHMPHSSCFCTGQQKFLVDSGARLASRSFDSRCCVVQSRPSFEYRNAALYFNCSTIYLFLWARESSTGYAVRVRAGEWETKKRRNGGGWSQKKKI